MHHREHPSLLRLDLLGLVLGPFDDLTLSRNLGSWLLTRRLALCLQARGILGKLLDIRQELWLTGEVLAQHLRHLDAVLTLVVLENTAKGTLSGAQSAVQGVAVGLLEGGIVLLLLPVTIVALSVITVLQRVDNLTYRISSSRVW